MNVNRETADDSKLKEHRVSIEVVGEMHTFVIWIPEYVSSKFSPDDWTELGSELRELKAKFLRRMVADGSYFRLGGRAQLYIAIEDGMRELIYRRFRNKQAEAGNDAWAVPHTLQGEEYRTK